jgi:hypothetical protein
VAVTVIGIAAVHAVGWPWRPTFIGTEIVGHGAMTAMNGRARVQADALRIAPREREWQEIPKDVSVTIVPDDKSLDALAQHVKQTGHAFSMFDVTRLILAAGDRYHVRFACADERATGLFHTVADGGFFLIER